MLGKPSSSNLIIENSSQHLQLLHHSSIMKLTLNYKDQAFQIQHDQQGLKVDNKSVQSVVHSIQKDVYHVNIDGINYEIFVLEKSADCKQLKLKVNQNIIELSIKDTFDALLEQMGMQFKTVQRVTDLKAPMPGLVTDVCVVEGQTVVKGDTLLKLEAMKMENNIKATGEGIISKIIVSKGQTVEKNQALILFQ